MNTELGFILILGARPELDGDQQCVRCSTPLDPVDLELAHDGWAVVSCPACGAVIAA